MYVKALKWPVITWIVIDLAFAALFKLPGIGDAFGKIATDQAVTPLLVAIGVWAGYKMVQLGGNYLHAAVGGIIVGAVCAVGGVILFGVLLGFGVSAVLPGAVYDFAMNVFGAFIGGGYALTK